MSFLRIHKPLEAVSNIHVPGMTSNAWKATWTSDCATHLFRYDETRSYNRKSHQSREQVSRIKPVPMAKVPVTARASPMYLYVRVSYRFPYPPFYMARFVWHRPLEAMPRPRNVLVFQHLCADAGLPTTDSSASSGVSSRVVWASLNTSVGRDAKGRNRSAQQQIS
jgi:hypothetical protein